LLQRLDLPLRDILRLVLPGVVGLFIIDWMSYLFTGHHPVVSLSATNVLGLAFLIGGVSFAAEFHEWLPPWRKPWRAQLTEIREQLELITQQSRYLAEKHGKPMYKIWLEAICEGQVRGHLHNLTGLFYTFSAIATILAASIPFAVWAFAEQAWEFQQSGNHPLSALVWARLLTLPIDVLVIIFFTRGALGLMNDVNTEGMLAMNLESSRTQLRELANAAAGSGLLGMESDLVQQQVKTAIAALRPVEADRLQSVSEVRYIDQYDLRDDSVLKYAHVTAYARDYLDARLINGRANLFNGPIQYRIEGYLRETLGPLLSVARVRLQVAPGDRPLSECDFGSYERKEVQHLSLDTAIRLGIISDTGAVAKTCQDLQIDNVLIRNGQVIGPNPGLSVALKEALRLLSPSDVIYDPFSGTGLTRELVRLQGGRLVAQCDDAMAADGEATGFDAFQDAPTKHLALVVLDPFPENVIPYVTQKLPELDWSLVLVVSGDMSDIAWNEAVQDALERRARRMPLSGDFFGKQIYLYKKT
jgi:hypothetical protein